MDIKRAFLENDLVFITRNTCLHGFEIGQRVRLKTDKYTNNGFCGETLDGKDWWCIREEDIKLSFEKGDIVKVRKYGELCEEFNYDEYGSFYFVSTGGNEFKGEIESMNEQNEKLEVLGIDDGFIEVKDEGGAVLIFAPEVLEFTYEQNLKKEKENIDEETEDEIRVGSIVRGISDSYIITNTEMTEGLVTEINDEDNITVVVLKHESESESELIERAISEKRGYEVSRKHFKVVRQTYELSTKEDEEEKVINAPFKLTITSDGNTTNCTYEEHGKIKEVKAKLHPDDVFDFKAGVELCVERAFNNSINEGDIVEITDEGKMYSTYADWLVTNKIPVEIASRYCYGLDEIPLYKTYKVIKKANRLPDDKLQLLLIQDTNGGKVFLISEDGTRKVED